MDRSKAEELVKAVYGARVKGDVNEMMKLTDPDIVFEILGSNERSKVAVAIKGADTFRHSLSVLCENFELWNFEILTMLVEGDNCQIASNRDPLSRPILTPLARDGILLGQGNATTRMRMRRRCRSGVRA
jgi:ketosteroid isomerase-like protein